MFTKIRLKNFYSFKDITFDLHCAPKRYKHLAIVYGENGSGKTNLMSGLGVFIDLMRTMDVRDRIEQILYDQEHPENSEDAYPKLSAQILARALRSSESLFNECRMIGSSEPVCLQYEFLIHGKKGMYLVEFGKEGIIHERLEYVIEKRRGVYFDLTTEDKTINKTLFKSDTLKNDIADQIKKYLEDEGVEHALINLGGNMLAVGGRYDGTDFQIGIQKPFAETGTVLASVAISGKSVVSSGNYERYFEQDGDIYHHILNPATGYPADTGLNQVTIISDSSAQGDALSTTCFLLGLDKGMELIQSLDGVEAVFVTSDMKVHASSEDLPVTIL